MDDVLKVTASDSHAWQKGDLGIDTRNGGWFLFDSVETSLTGGVTIEMFKVMNLSTETVNGTSLQLRSFKDLPLLRLLQPDEVHETMRGVFDILNGPIVPKKVQRGSEVESTATAMSVKSNSRNPLDVAATLMELSGYMHAQVATSLSYKILFDRLAFTLGHWVEAAYGTPVRTTYNAVDRALRIQRLALEDTDDAPQQDADTPQVSAAIQRLPFTYALSDMQIVPTRVAAPTPGPVVDAPVIAVPVSEPIKTAPKADADLHAHNEAPLYFHPEYGLGHDHGTVKIDGSIPMTLRLFRQIKGGRTGVTEEGVDIRIPVGQVDKIGYGLVDYESFVARLKNAYADMYQSTRGAKRVIPHYEAAKKVFAKSKAPDDIAAVLIFLNDFRGGARDGTLAFKKEVEDAFAKQVRFFFPFALREATVDHIHALLALKNNAGPEMIWPFDSAEHFSQLHKNLMANRKAVKATALTKEESTPVLVNATTQPFDFSAFFVRHAQRTRLTLAVNHVHPAVVVAQAVKPEIAAGEQNQKIRYERAWLPNTPDARTLFDLAVRVLSPDTMKVVSMMYLRAPEYRADTAEITRETGLSATYAQSVAQEGIQTLLRVAPEPFKTVVKKWKAAIP